MDNIVEKLKALGFNSYEAKVYIALLKKYPATGYEVSQMADIPQSRAYDRLQVIKSLLHLMINPKNIPLLHQKSLLRDLNEK